MRSAVCHANCGVPRTSDARSSQKSALGSGRSRGSAGGTPFLPLMAPLLLQPQPRRERRWPVPCLSDPASAPASPWTRRPSNPEPPGHNGSGSAAPVTPSSRRRQMQRPAVGRAAGVPKSLAMPPQLPVRFMQVLDRLHAEARRPGGAQRPPGARCAPSPPARLPGPFGRRAGATGCPREPRHRPPGSPGRPSGLAGWPRPQEGVSRGQGLRPDPEPRAARCQGGGLVYR